MRLLCLETSARTCSVALAEGSACVWAGERRDEASFVHAEELVPLIDRGMREIGWQAADLAAVAVSIGPGSYTGLRIGVATAKGLCHALGLPLVVLETPGVCVAGLELGPEATEVVEGDVAVGVVDARRMEVFAGCYRRVGEGWEQLTAPGAVVLDGEGPGAAKRFGVDLGDRTWFVGDAAMKMRAVLDGPGKRFVDRPATAAAMVRGAHAAAVAGRFADLAYTTPDYGKTYLPGAVRNPLAT